MGRRLLRTPELADRFVSEAAVILEDRGPGALTTRAVADASGSSLAALNGLFGSKTGLLNVVALRGFSMLLEALDAAVTLEPGTPAAATATSGQARASIIELCAGHRRFAADNPRLVAHMYAKPFAELDPTEQDLEMAVAIRRHFTSHLATLLQRPRSTAAVFDTAVGLVALIDGLTAQQRAGTLGSTAKTANRRWNSAIEVYLDGASSRYGTPASAG